MPHQLRRLCLQRRRKLPDHRCLSTRQNRSGLRYSSRPPSPSHHPHYSYQLKRSRPQSWSHRHDQLCRLRRLRPLT
jgi:hypothetical protein